MKILSLLRPASKKDWHWLNKFIKSPIFNQNEDAIRLFEILRLQKNKTNNEQFSKKISTEFFEGETVDSAKFHHASNYLLQCVEDYYAFDEWWNDDSSRQRFILQACRKKGLDKYFHEKLGKVRASLDKKKLRHADHLRFRYHLALEDYEYSMQTGRNAAEQLQSLSEWHDLAFIAEKLKNACGIVSRQRVLRMELDMGLLPHVLEYVQTRPHVLAHTAIAIYYYGYLALTEPDQDEHYFALKKHLPLAAEQFPLRELGDVYFLAINFCIHRINMREATYLREVFELYKDGLHTGVFMDKGNISRFTYTNIALAGLRLQEFEWVYGFLFQYKDKLPEGQRQGAFSFNLARFYCERQDYSQAMALLLEMDFDDVLHNLTAKAMLAKMYFETSEPNALDSLLASLSAYLRRKRQVSEQQRAAYKNFIRFVKKLQSVNNKHTAARAALRAEIVETAIVAEKDWLLRMLSAH